MDESYSNIGFDENKIKAKISKEKLNSFKSNFPQIKINTTQFKKIFLC